MLDRDACERRVYRLATLLTGNPISATRVIEQVIDAQPDLRRLDSAHMDRLTVLRSREIKSHELTDAGLPHPVAHALGRLSRQQREAWVFSHLYRLDDREIARAMDCSVTAARRHLEVATGAVARALGPEAASAPQVLLSYSMSLDVPAFFRAARRQRRRIRIAVLTSAVILFVLLVLAVGLFLWHTGRGTP